MRTPEDFWDYTWEHFDPGKLSNVKSVFEEHLEQTRQFLTLVPEDAPVIDFGCGFGRNALFLARRGNRVWVSDISSRALDLSVALAAYDHLEVSPVPYHRGRIECGDGCFHGALAWSVLDHMSMEEAATVVAELARICASGAVVLCSFDGREGDPGSEHELLEDGTIRCSRGPREGMLIRFYDPDEIEHLFRRGWSILGLTGERPEDRKTILCRRC